MLLLFFSSFHSSLRSVAGDDVVFESKDAEAQNLNVMMFNHQHTLTCGKSRDCVAEVCTALAGFRDTILRDPLAADLRIVDAR